MRLTGHRILVVEDDPMISLDLEHILMEAGAEVAGTASSISRAMELAGSLALSAAIVDLRLQNESARPVAERLQQLGVPFVFYSPLDLISVPTQGRLNGDLRIASDFEEYRPGISMLPLG